MKKSAFINTSNLSKQSQICVYIFIFKQPIATCIYSFWNIYRASRYVGT